MITYMRTDSLRLSEEDPGARAVAAGRSESDKALIDGLFDADDEEVLNDEKMLSSTPS